MIHSLEASIPTDNRTFRYGYGLFETMLVNNGQLQLANLHWERLFSGLKKLHFDISPFFTPEKLEKEVLSSVHKNNLNRLCRVRLQVYASGGGIFDFKNNTPNYIIECFELEQSVTLLNENGLVVGLAKDVCKSMDSLSNLKSCNALVYAIAAIQSKEEKWNDALVTNSAGNIIESTIANIFWVKDNYIYTPPLSEGCVAGVMRRQILAQNTAIIEQPLTHEALLNADEVFLTNAIKKIKWVGRYGDVTYSNKIIKNLVGLL